MGKDEALPDGMIVLVQGPLVVFPWAVVVCFLADSKTKECIKIYSLLSQNSCRNFSKFGCIFTIKKKLGLVGCTLTL